MASEKQKFQKKKKREERVRKQLLLQRQDKTEKSAAENRLRKKLNRISKLKKGLGQHNMWSDDVLLKMPEKTLSQLEHNAQILKALEEEFENEVRRKRKLNEGLEGEGLHSLEDKLNALHQRLVEDQKKAGTELLEDELKLLEQAKAEALKFADENGSIFEDKVAGFAPAHCHDDHCGCHHLEVEKIEDVVKELQEKTENVSAS